MVTGSMLLLCDNSKLSHLHLGHCDVDSKINTQISATQEVFTFANHIHFNILCVRSCPHDSIRIYISEHCLSSSLYYDMPCEFICLSCKNKSKYYLLFFRFIGKESKDGQSSSSNGECAQVRHMHTIMWPRVVSRDLYRWSHVQWPWPCDLHVLYTLTTCTTLLTIPYLYIMWIPMLMFHYELFLGCY